MKLMLLSLWAALMLLGIILGFSIYIATGDSWKLFAPLCCGVGLVGAVQALREERRRWVRR